MRSVVYWGVRDDGYGGRVQVQIEPSYRYPPGVYVAYNDHYDLTKGHDVLEDRTGFADMPTDDSAMTSDKVPEAIDILTEKWTASMLRFNHVFEALSVGTGISHA
jgi:hypothetical protein